jgi:hypothetical protein
MEGPLNQRRGTKGIYDRFMAIENRYINNQIPHNRPIEFKIFYWLVMLYLAIMTFLNWFTAANISYWKDEANEQ